MKTKITLLALLLLPFVAAAEDNPPVNPLGNLLQGIFAHKPDTAKTPDKPAAQPTDKAARNLGVKESGAAAKRVALVIGNDHYSAVTPLKNAVADARSMAAELKRAGFDVTLKTDADLDAMKLAVRQFKAKLSGGDEAIFFYSGHGVQLGAANYLLPVNVASDNEEQVKDDAIPLQRLLDDLQDQKVKFALAIIDACRDNPFKGSGRSIGGTRGLAPTSAANGQMVIFSAGNGQQALDKLGNNDRDKNGVFTRVFLQEMQKPGVEVHQVLRNVRSRVVQMAKSVNHDQMPALYDQVEGDFHFYQVASLEAVPTPGYVPPAARTKNKEEIEDDYWDDIKDSGDLTSYEQYRKAYPKGRYLNTANLKIAQLKKKTQDAATVTPPPVVAQVPTRIKKSGEEIEDDTWNSAESANTIEAIKAYLTGYPKGRYVAQARIKLATLKPSSDKPAEPVAPPVAPNKNDPDATLWAEAQKGNTVEDYQVYVDSYPKGKYLPFAKARIKKLNEAAQAAAEQQEQSAWDSAQQENSEASYSLYLKGYPNGRFAGLAKVRHEKLKNDIAAKEETALWTKADSGNDKASVETYLNRYPSGRYLAAASAKLQAIKEEEAKGPAMVRIPGRNYEMGKYEVTQAEWKAVMGSNPSNFASCGDSCPVERASWDDIQAFLQKLNAKTGRQYRLPSEAEWEYACYGGSQSEYCGGNDLDAVGWYGNNGQPGGNSNQTTHPAGQKQANGYGLYDMSGNVWEWMQDKWDNEHDWRVLRGGSWINEPQNVRVAYRSRYVPAGRYINYGFRLTRTLP